MFSDISLPEELNSLLDDVLQQVYGLSGQVTELESGKVLVVVMLVVK